MLSYLGKNSLDEYLESFMSEAPGLINLTVFVTMFELSGTDPEDVCPRIH